MDRNTGKPRGLASVEFSDSDGASKGLELDGEELLGRYLKISWKKERTDTPRFNSRGGGQQGGGGRGGGHREKPADCCTVFCGNLSFGVENSSLGDFFSECGTVLSARVVTDKETGESRGYVNSMLINFVDCSDETCLLDILAHFTSGSS